MTRAPIPRNGFTLIELLVVISIIGVLVGLLIPAVQYARKSGQRAAAVSEINQLNAAITKFKQDTGFYPPNVFTIPGTKASGDVNFQLLQRMFPRWMSTAPEGTSTGLANAGTTLQGIEVVVYFLGGPTGTGWAPDAPVAPTGENKKGPWMDFPANRLDGRKYLDPWRNEFGYHASRASGNYSSWAGEKFAPYQSGGKFVNQGGVQIVSAGPNGEFGPGGNWTPGTGYYTSAGLGGDDLANFNNGQMLNAQP